MSFLVFQSGDGKKNQKERKKKKGKKKCVIEWKKWMKNELRNEKKWNEREKKTKLIYVSGRCD